MILNQQNDRVRTKILNAIMEDPEIVLVLKEKYVDENIWKFCIEREPELFKKMKHPSEGICMYACSVDGSNLKYIKNKFHYIKITDIMCFTAVKSNPKAILSVPDELLNDELKEMAFDEDPSLMAYFDDVRNEYVEKLLKEKPYAIRYVRNLDEEMICNAIKESPDICPYLSKVTENMAKTLETFHPAYYALYKNNINKDWSVE
jgi:hypothetical protein